MEIDADKVDRDKLLELEDSPTPVVTLDSAIRQKLIDLTNPKASLSRTGVKHECVE